MIFYWDDFSSQIFNLIYEGTVAWERSDEIWKITIYEDILYFENIESIQ